MDIDIIGTGNMARGIARRALAGGHSVTLLGTGSESARALAGDLSVEVRTATVGDDLSGDLVVLTIPYGAIDDVLSRYGDQLDRRVVIDITDPVDFSSFTPLNVEAGSAAQEIARKAPRAKVVKAFDTTFAGQPLDAGRIARAHELEALGYLHMALQSPLYTGFASGVKIVS